MRVLLIFFVLSASIAAAADSMPFSRFSGADVRVVGREQIATGGVEIESPDLFVTADEARYSRDTQVLTATGNIVLTHLQLRLLADRLEYNPSTQVFEARNVKIGAPPYYVEGPVAHGVGEEITVDDAHAYFGEPGRWQPTLAAAKIIYAPGKRLRAENARIGVGPVFGIRLPQFEHGINEPLFSHISLNAGYRSSLGGFLAAGLRVPVGSDVRVGGDVGFYWKRGVMAGPSLDYGSVNPGEPGGQFTSGYINDHGEKKTDVRGDPVPEERGFIEWRHRQMISPDTTLAAHVSYWRDSEIVRDFYPGAFVNVQEPDTYLEASSRGANSVTTLFGRFRPNSFERVQQRLPEVTFDLLPHDIGHGLLEEFHASAAVLREYPILGGPALRSKRVDAYYQLRAPLAPAEWLSFAPVVGGRLTYYSDTKGATAPSAGTFTRTFGEMGFDAELRVAGRFDYKNDAWKIDGLRHLLTPRLSYRFTPGADRVRGNIPMIDRSVFTNYLSPLDIAATRNVDDLAELNVVRIGIDNTLQTRDANYGSRDLFTFNAAVDYAFQRRGGQEDFSDIHLEFAATPAPWLRFDAYQSLSSRTLALRQVNTALTLNDGTAWSIRFANHFLEHDTEEYSGEGTWRFNEAYEMVARLAYDARRSRLVERSVGLRQNLGNTWLVEYNATVHDGPRREGRLGLSVQVRSIGF